jgi:tetratricopeptide (TPR) repeat protein
MAMRERLSNFQKIACLLAMGLVPWFGLAAGDGPQGSASTAKKGVQQDPQALFAKGQAALQDGNLDGAEKAFREVLTMDPQAGAAYSNLGVIAMRRKDWNQALRLLQRAAKLEPKVSGIRLNIGLVYYHQGEYGAAIAPLLSVVREQPDSRQARYLLGLCELFTKHYDDAVIQLEPLWPQESNDVMYLYVFSIAAHNAGKNDVDERALARLVEVGGETPEFHLILGKAYLNRYQVPEATAELERAAAGNANLPFLHFDLGIAYMGAGDNERAEAEFRKDIALEPDLADNYEQLGVLYARLQKDAQAEKAFREALERDAKSEGAYLGLAKLYQKQQKLPEALKMVDAAVRLSPETHGSHFLRGRILTQLGRQKEAQAEFAAAEKTIDKRLDKERESAGELLVPNPELKQQPPP